MNRDEAEKCLQVARRLLAQADTSDADAADAALDRAIKYAEKGKRLDADAAGARGLMQIMPATASHITQDRSLARANKDKLLDPTFNITLGQDYLTELMGSGEPYGNLFMLTTAYNGGPGNLNRWLASM